jgi:hypothetical protein
LDHRFREFHDEFQTLVLFSNASPDLDGQAFLSFLDEELKGRAEPARNVWDPFLETGSLRLGVYLLPADLDGDRPLVHDFDELNSVNHGFR